MKHNIYNILVAGALMLGFASCHDDVAGPDIVSGDEGTLQLSSLSIDMSDAEKVIQSTAGRASVDLNDFLVYITPKGSTETIKTYHYGDMPEILTLPAGEYTVQVESHKILKAEWDHPYYKGSQDFAITAGEITNIDPVTARFSSLKVTIRFSDDLRAVLGDNAKVTILANDEGLLTYTPAETRSGYFEVVENSQTMIAHFEGDVDGTFTTFDTPFTDIEAGQHRIITYKTKSGPSIPEQSGQIDPSGGIQLDADVEIVGIDGNVTVDEDLLDGSDRPGKENPKDPTPGPGPEPGPGGDDSQHAASFEATNSPNLKLDAVNTVTEDFGNAIVTITCPKGIKNLVVTIDTDSGAFRTTLGDLGLDKPFDLAYPGDLEEQIGEEGLGLATGDKVINQTSVLFNITDFVPLLNIYPGTHKFMITVTDNDNKAETLSLVFKS